MRFELPFFLKIALAGGLFVLMVPSFYITWESVSAAFSPDGYCTDKRSGFSFVHIIEKDAPKVHIPVSENTAMDGEGQCAVAVASYTDPITAMEASVTVDSAGVLTPVDTFTWKDGEGMGLMGRLVQAAMLLSVLLMVGSLVILCLQDEEVEEYDDA